MEGDSITGITVQRPAHRVAIAIADITKMESNELQMGRTFRYALSIFAGTVLFVMILMSG